MVITDQHQCSEGFVARRLRLAFVQLVSRQRARATAAEPVPAAAPPALAVLVEAGAAA